MTLVVHLIDFSTRNAWIENQLTFLTNSGLDQALISIAEPGEIHERLRLEGFEKIQAVDRTLPGLLKARMILRKWSRNEVIFVYAHGHTASIFASCLKVLTGTKFIICHHQQPEFFTQLKKRARFKASIHILLARFYLWSSTRIQSFSPEVFESLQRKGIPLKKIVQIPLGLSFKDFYELDASTKLDSGSGPIRIVSVSRLVWEKRVDLGIRSIAEILRLGIDVEYCVVGDGPEMESLKNLAAELGVTNSVKFLGRQENVNELLNASDIFFHLSLTESYGQVLMEARLTGLPIFSSPCGVALEMQAQNDSKVRIFHGETSKEIALELSQFLDSIGADENQASLNPRETYRHHEYQEVLVEVSKMFHSLT